ncbi:S41 family peptidase [Asticcacaulis machinosus]|uniref:S41 family peptidase n=1 Tax=Asticcacaulis machinosus TaxID=2984211 RepID=A0ABT5HIZ5_9CAUL|nr:S41 family peptidase [Asticcacaulis machinosus]MDC7676215.1 S41 family peptidase [Asticcacaulis machinosus]
MFCLKKIATLGLIFAATALTGCGGGGGGGGGTTGGGSVPQPAGWVSGVFSAASTFKNQCQTVRTGVDIEGNAYPDRAGTELAEKNWLRSWTRETYLWNTEVTDTNPANGGTRTEYFATLKTLALTASGAPKDQFHFSEPTTEYLARRNAVASASYGAEFAILSGSVPRDVRVLYTDPNSPAEEMAGGQKKLIRGTQILRVNGIDLVNGGSTEAEINILNNGLFPPATGVTTTMEVRDPGTTTTRTITLTAQNLSAKAVNRTRVLPDGAGGKIGYVLFNTFSPNASEAELAGAMTTMRNEGVRDMVLDLRYNGGGLLAVASQLSYMVAGDARTTNRNFESLRFNALAGSRNPVTGQANNPVPFYTTGLGFSLAQGTALPTLNLPRVFVLTTDATCSASEAVINGLRGIGVEVVQIGGRTCGKPYGFYPQDNCGETYYTIQFQGVNHAGFGDYADGFVPANAATSTGVKIAGCSANDDLTRELGDSTEGLLRAAIGYATTGACPTPPPVATSAIQSGAFSSRNAGGSLRLEAPEKGIMDTNRDMTMR